MIRLILFFFCSFFSLCAYEVKVSLSHNSISLHDSFTATFLSPQNIDSQPDFTPLQADFKILSNSQSFKTSIINGQITQESKWTLALMAKHEGKLTIPSIHFGSEASEPQTIEVTSAPANTKSDDLFLLETEVNPKSSYEQTPIIYTVRFHRSANIAQGSLSEPEVRDFDALIEKIGEDREYERFHSNGRRYIVLERNYAVIPQNSGELVFDPIIFEGRIVTGSSRSFFNTQTQFKRLISGQEKVTVKPIPAPFNKSNWFAANDLKFVEEWSSDPEKILLGEPITWTLTLMAEGCPGNQIPSIAFNFPSELKQYADKPQISNEKGQIGLRREKVALIATKSGSFTLPEIKIKWWDLKAGQLRETIIPAKTIQVQAPVQSNEIAMKDPEPKEIAVPQILPSVAKEESTKEEVEIPLWTWGVMSMNLLWIAGLVFLLRQRIFKKSDSLKQIRNQLKKACKANDAKQAEICLLNWSEKVFLQEKVRTITALKKHVSPSFQAAIDGLNLALYSQKEVIWDGEALWKVISEYKEKAETAKPQPQILRDLYPS